MRGITLIALVTAGVLLLAGGAAAEPVGGFTELLSVSTAGVQGDQDSEAPAVSADGHFVAFAVVLRRTSSPRDTNQAVGHLPA